MMETTVQTDWQGIVLVISALGTLITGVIAALANYNASKAKLVSDETLKQSQSNTVKLRQIEANTNSLSHAITNVAQTDADARLVAAKALPTAGAPVAVVVPTPVKEEK